MTSRTLAAAERLLDETTALRLTLLILLLRPPGEGLLRGLTWLVAGLALALPSLTRSAGVWLLLAGLVFARLIDDWPLSDNHIYLLGYWCLGLGLCLLLSSPQTTIADMSRRLVGSAFLCAVVWKGVLAPDFLDARFFRMTLLADERFDDLARAAGGLTRAELDANRAALTPLPQGAEMLGGPVLVEPPSLKRLGLSMTWGGLVLELLIACAFLLTRPAALFRHRHALLIAFAALTYAAAPVAGFGWLLAAMGLAQCAGNDRALRVGYVAVFALVLVYAETPLLHLVLDRIAP